jgi:small subunit ribosomal protein S17
MKTINGKVISNKMMNTVVVEATRFEVHPMYGKRMKRNMKFHAHTEKKIDVGEVVSLRECKPYSKTKAWEVIQSPTKKHGSA